MKYFNFVAAILLSLLYATGKIPPSEKFNLWFTIFVIPFAMLANTILLIVAIVMSKKSGLYYIIPMIIGVPYMISTIGVKHFFKKESSKPRFSIMNYNISHLSVKPGGTTGYDSGRKILMDLVLHPTTDIQCYQEFVNFPRSKDLNIISRLEERNMNFYFSMEPDNVNTANARAGILIVSKYPIVSRGDILESTNGFNRVAYADVKINEDTVRVINVHLESMGLGQFDPRYRSRLSEMKNKTRTILSKLKFGVLERSKQIKQVADFVATSPYPVICVGDFNDMPYSYSYQYLKWRMKNSFEESGSGFGFTYNGGTLRTLRIDNQFYSGRVRSTDLKTRYDMAYTDHFPLVGTYEFNDRE
ncbi:MAG: endonuclease/exonuclease/phosphatase family protein [Chryseolinea sp.]